MKKYQNFLSENFHFVMVKFSVYSNRHRNQRTNEPGASYVALVTWAQ